MKKTILISGLVSLSAIAGCKKDEALPDGHYKVTCKNEKGEPILSSIAKEEVIRLKNGGVKFKDANGSYIIGKGDCEVK